MVSQDMVAGAQRAYWYLPRPSSRHGDPTGLQSLLAFLRPIRELRSRSDSWGDRTNARPTSVGQDNTAEVLKGLHLAAEKCVSILHTQPHLQHRLTLARWSHESAPNQE